MMIPLEISENTSDNTGNAALKLLWVLDEPLKQKEHVGPKITYWSLAELLNNYIDAAHKWGLKKSAWYLTVYASYGIINSYLQWQQLEEIRQEPTLNRVLKSISIIYVKKTAGNFVPRWHEIATIYKTTHDKLNEKIVSLKPDVVIFGGTFAAFERHIQFHKIDENAYSGCIDCFSFLAVDAEHPHGKGMQYINDIVEHIEHYFITYKI